MFRDIALQNITLFQLCVRDAKSFVTKNMSINPDKYDKSRNVKIYDSYFSFYSREK